MLVMKMKRNKLWRREKKRCWGGIVLRRVQQLVDVDEVGVAVVPRGGEDVDIPEHGHFVVVVVAPGHIIPLVGVACAGVHLSLPARTLGRRGRGLRVGGPSASGRLQPVGGEASSRSGR